MDVLVADGDATGNKTQLPIQSLLQSICKAHNNWITNISSKSKRLIYNHLRQSVQVNQRLMKKKWWQDQAHAIQKTADEHDMKRFNICLKTVFGLQHKGFSPISSSDGLCLLTNRNKIIQKMD